MVTPNPTTPAHRFFILVLITLAGSLLAAMVLPPQTLAALPPRPTPSPTPSPRHDDTDSDDSETVGGQIELQVQPSSSRLWTVVQWQDALGSWHDVEGWQGSLDDGARKEWWVARSDFGKGPFRWAMCENPMGNSFAESRSFFLPRSANETVKVDLSLVP